ELNLDDLASLTSKVTEIRPHTEEYTLKNGRRIYVLAQGRLVNLVAAEGHPSEVMDMSFANQFLALLQLSREGRNMEKKVYVLPPQQDQEIARIKLETMGIRIDSLSKAQESYITDYSAGT
ncbi:unnamed protein product, partial [marine sediment metagenome]